MSEEEKKAAQEEEVKESAEEAAKEAAEEGAQDAEQKAEEAAGAAEPKADEAQQESEKYARLYAEFQNYKRRTEKEKSDLYAYAGEKFAVDLLEVIDSFERAMAAKPEGDKFAEGMEMILTQLKAVLAKNHVEEIEALGKPFDPNMHNAVMHVESEDLGENVIAQVFQKGYKIGNTVVRFATVQVAN